MAGAEQLVGFCPERSAIVFECVEGASLEALYADAQLPREELSAERALLLERAFSWQGRLQICASMMGSLERVLEHNIYLRDIRPGEHRQACTRHELWWLFQVHRTEQGGLC